MSLCTSLKSHAFYPRTKSNSSPGATLVCRTTREIIIIFIVPVMHVMECWLSSNNGGDRQKMNNQRKFVRSRASSPCFNNFKLHVSISSQMFIIQQCCFFMIQGGRYVILMNMFRLAVMFNARDKCVWWGHVDLHILLFLTVV